MLTDGYKSTYVANVKALKSAIVKKLNRSYRLNTKGEIGALKYVTVSKEEVEDREEAGFIYRVVAFTREGIQLVVEIS